MKRLFKTVDLVFFEDESGTHGVTHKETVDGFDAFWNGIGLFHDVFEHSHEHTHKYFRGDYAMNLGGEMAAMGALWYFYDSLGVYNRLKANGMYAPSEIMREGTSSHMVEYLQDGYTRTGPTLTSKVPAQRPTDNGELEYQIAEYWKLVQRTSPSTKYEQEMESAIEYKKSVTFRKIADLHRYGYRMAERMVPENWENRATLVAFIDFFETFCKNNSAETLARIFRKMVVKLYKDENGFVSWKVVLIAQDGTGVKNYTIRHDNDIQDDLEYTDWD